LMCQSSHVLLLAAIWCVHQCLNAIMPDVYGKQHLCASRLLFGPCLHFPVRFLPCAWSTCCFSCCISHLLHCMYFVGIWGGRGCTTPLRLSLATFCSLLSGSHDT
jgi:hypothetical protein